MDEQPLDDIVQGKVNRGDIILLHSRSPEPTQEEPHVSGYFVEVQGGEINISSDDPCMPGWGEREMLSGMFYPLDLFKSYETLRKHSQ